MLRPYARRLSTRPHAQKSTLCGTLGPISYFGPDTPCTPRILVPVDRSSFSNQILPLASTIAKSTGAQLALYRVVEQSDKLTDVERELRVLADAHRAQAICKEVHGYVAEAILEEAERVPGTLVAITSHGRSGVMRALLGARH